MIQHGQVATPVKKQQIISSLGAGCSQRCVLRLLCITSSWNTTLNSGDHQTMFWIKVPKEASSLFHVSESFMDAGSRMYSMENEQGKAPHMLQDGDKEK
ncbi:hypothetical protein VNO77_16830 [Canavalia gladiata]|uniref:Uncharacterized protein n=1 Tax=Canavalia gladiata TaxID=3824 RepID=A0AAN9LLD7_CANGL